MTNRQLYKKAAEFLKENPDKILQAWNFPNDDWFGVLFRFATKSGERDEFACGCPVQLKCCQKSGYINVSEEVKKIIFDSKLPETGKAITTDHMNEFVKVNCKLDKVLNRKIPDWYFKNADL